MSVWKITLVLIEMELIMFVRKNIFYYLLVVVILGISTIKVAGAETGNEIIVKFKPGVDTAQAYSILQKHQGEVLKYIQALNMYVVKLPENSTESLAETLVHIANDPSCEYAEEDLATGQGGLVPNDTFIGSQWHHNSGAINSIDAWDVTRGSSEVTIAVLDSGILPNHPEFTGQRFLQGFDFVNEDNDPLDDLNHGFFVTALLSGNADNSFGGAGVDHAATILPVKVINQNNSGTTADLVEAITFSAEQGADIISMSLINYPGAQSLIDAMQFARNEGVILIACAGNGGIGNADVSFPGASSLTMSIGATTSSNVRAGFSGTGANLDFVAPGSGLIVSTFNNNNTTTSFGGCSAATPVTAGVVGLMKAVNPALTHDEVRSILVATARDQVGNPSEDTVGRDNFYGHGLIDAKAAVDEALAQAQILTVVDDSVSVAIDSGLNTLDVLANDNGVDLAITAVTQGAGTVAISTDGLSLEYTTPADTSLTADSFTYTVTDASGQIAVATVNVSLLNASEPVSVEAESAVILGTASVYADAVASNGQGVAFISTEGAGFRLENVPAANTVTFHYASQASGGLSVFVNGQDVGNVNFNGNGVWTGSYTSVDLSIAIPEDATFEIIFQNGDAAMNIDRLVFSNNTPPPPPPPGEGEFGFEFISDTSAILFHVDQGWTASFNFLCLNGDCRSGTRQNGRFERVVTGLSLGASYQIEFKVQDNAISQCLTGELPIVFDQNGATIDSPCAE